jgi:hypothetical protein
MPNFDDFITKLRRYKKSNIVELGSELTWSVFKNRSSYGDEYTQVINAFAPRLVILGLAVGNDLRSTVLNNTKFYNLCHDYLDIADPITDIAFKKKEDSEIVFELGKENKNKTIPDKYLDLKFISGTSELLFLARNIRQQNEISYVSLNEFYMLYDVLTQLNELTEGRLNRDFIELFEVTPLLFVRSILGLFTLANNESRNGRIFLKEETCDDNIKIKLQIDLDTCKLAASKISLCESTLRDDWYENKVKKQPELYQKFYPIPLYKSPIIEMNKSKRIDYLIPSPGLFIRGVADAIFSRLFAKTNLSSNLGDLLENHVYVGLKNIFGIDNVFKIPKKNNDKQADFIIELDNCILVLECKSNAGGGFEDLSIMSPKNVAEIWWRLFTACQQCAATVKEIGKKDKPIIPIILVAMHSTAEALPFQSFAMKSNIFIDMGLEHVEFFSWTELQYCLSKSSIRKFAEKIIERYDNEDILIGEIANFNLEKDTPAHSYQYLKNIENKIFAKN